jgi:HK97 family phage prohead protease
MEQMQKKFLSEIKDLDPTKGVVEAYANAYNNEDSDGDISAYGSFVKTVSENIRKLRVYKNHDRKLMIGVPIEIDAYDTYGLKTITQFNMNTELGRDMFYDVKLTTDNNQDADLSIGYSVVQRDTKNSKIIKEYNLKEYSFLTSWGANSLAFATGIKSVNNSKEFIELLTKMYNIPYSDARLMQVEDILKSLTLEPFKDTLIVEPIEQINIIKSFTQSLNIK